MAWIKEAITDGELDALARAARMAWADDTCLLRYSSGTAVPRDPRSGAGQCYVTALWLVRRLGGTIGKREGHFVWLSHDKLWYIDLTGDHTGRVAYERNADFSYQPYVHVSSVDAGRRAERFEKRADHIFDNLDTLLKYSTDIGGGDAFPAEEPQAASDSAQFDSYWHDEPTYQPQSQVYQFFYANGQMEVSPNHSHDELATHLGINAEQHVGPVAAGHIVVNNGKATYEVATNVNIKALDRIFKDHAKQVGWQWGGITNAEGEPISDEFAPKTTKTLNWVYDSETDHLRIGRVSNAELVIDLAASTATDHRTNRGQRQPSGQARILGSKAFVAPVVTAALPSLLEWAEDSGLTLYAGNDNVYQVIPDDQQGNDTDPNVPSNSNLFGSPSVDEREPSGLHRCPSCDRLFGSWHDYSKHRREEESWGDPHFPDSPNMDDALPAHFTPYQPEGITTGAVIPVSVHEARRVDGFARYAQVFDYDTDEGHTHYVAYLNGSPVGYATVREADKHLQMVYTAMRRKNVARRLVLTVMNHYPELRTTAMHDWESAPLRKAGWVNITGQTWKWSLRGNPSQTLEAPVPFIFDVQDDKVFVGNPGQRTSDIPGKFTPGGIVEGNYEPGGKVVIRSMTTIPYSVRHLIQLWYYSHPELEVKSVHLQDDEGKDTRLAAAEVGHMVTQLALTDPAVDAAYRSLSSAGGQVYVVGGAVRDTILGKTANDFDLMVTGIPKDAVAANLRTLAKRTKGYTNFKGKDFGVFRFRYAESEVEISLPRLERSTGDGHRDFDVDADHTLSPEADLYRRDFTANALAVNLHTGAVIDPYAGAADIASGTLRVLNDDTFIEDPLRILRAVVAHARHGLEPDTVTRVQMRDNAHRISHLPAERIQVELDKLIEADRPSAGIRLAHSTGVLQHILPEVDATFGYDQKNPHHAHDLGTHLLEVLDRMSAMTQDADLRYAALLHDIGKPASAWWHPEDKRCKYYEYRPDRDLVGVAEDGSPLTIKQGSIVGKHHQEVGAVMAADRLRELKFPNDRIQHISTIILHHMWKAFETKKGARKFLARTGVHADDLIMFRIADQGGKGDAVLVGDGRTPEGIAKQANLIERVRNEGEATHASDLAIDGHDLIEIGITAGPKLGQIKAKLVERVIDDPALNHRDTLLTLARKLTLNDQ